MSAKFTVRVCRGPTCGDQQRAIRIADEFQRLIEERGLVGEVEMLWQSCYGRCSKGPNVLVRAPKKNPVRQRTFALATPPPSRGGPATMYNYVHPADVIDIVTEHLQAGRPARELVRRAKQLDAQLEAAQGNTGQVSRDGE